MATVYDSYTWVISSPTSDTDYGGPKMPVAATAVEVSSYVVGGTSAVFNIEERSTVNVSGGIATEIISDQTADVDGATTTSFTNSSLAADCYPYLSVGTVTGDVTTLAVTLAWSYTI